MWVRKMPNFHNPKSTVTIEKKINQYITLRLVAGRTYIYVNGRKFIQCIRLILSIPKSDVHLYDEVDSIDEAAQLYSKHIFQNRIVRGPMAAPVSNQTHDITPEQEFWGHCSNIQAWVEHDYDTRILMSNISFPLLRELTKAGDPKARKVYKEEIALRLESGHPSVVQYLLTQGYIQVFSPEEFKSILDASALIKNLSTKPKILSRFLRSCVSKFPTLIEDILIQILILPEGKKIFLSIIQTPSRMSRFRPYRYSNSRFFITLKTALEYLILRDNEKMNEDIQDCLQEVNKKLRKLKGKVLSISNVSGRRYYGAPKNILLNFFPFDELNEHQKLIFKNKILGQIRRNVLKCAYCGKVIPKGQDVCEWCGHKKDDGGGSMKEAIAVPVKIKS